LWLLIIVSGLSQAEKIATERNTKPRNIECYLIQTIESHNNWNNHPINWQVLTRGYNCILFTKYEL
jgi:hypothetical protein